LYDDGRIEEGIFKNNQIMENVVDKSMHFKFKILIDEIMIK